MESKKPKGNSQALTQPPSQADLLPSRLPGLQTPLQTTSLTMSPKPTLRRILLHISVEI